VGDALVNGLRIIVEDATTGEDVTSEILDQLWDGVRQRRVPLLRNADYRNDRQHPNGHANRAIEHDDLLI
jgi:hypothetical protein